MNKASWTNQTRLQQNMKMTKLDRWWWWHCLRWVNSTFHSAVMICLKQSHVLSTEKSQKNTI